MKEQDTSKNTKLSISGLPGRHGNISAEKPKNSKQTILRLWKYLSRQKLLILLIITLLLLNIATTLAGSYLLRPIINKYIIPHNVPGLKGMILLFLVIYVTGVISNVL